MVSDGTVAEGLEGEQPAIGRLHAHTPAGRPPPTPVQG